MWSRLESDTSKTISRNCLIPKVTQDYINKPSLVILTQSLFKSPHNDNNLGVLVSAKPARVLSTELKNGVLVPTFHFTSEK